GPGAYPVVRKLRQLPGQRCAAGLSAVAQAGRDRAADRRVRTTRALAGDDRTPGRERALTCRIAHGATRLTHSRAGTSDGYPFSQVGRVRRGVDRWFLCAGAE